MMSLAKWSAGFAVWLSASLAGGWTLFMLYSMLPFNMPYVVETFIRFCLFLTGHDELANPDDMELVASLLFSILFSAAAGIAVLMFAQWLGRYNAARKSGSVPPALPLVIKGVLFYTAALVAADAGWYLTSLFTLFPFHLPAFVDGGVRDYLSLTGLGDPASYADRQWFGMVFYWIVATTAVAAVILLAYGLLTHVSRSWWRS